MEIIPAPGRQLKTWSFWLTTGAGLFDMVVLLMKTLGDQHVMTAEQVLAINAVLLTAAGAARFIKQQIEMTSDQKVEVIKSVAAQPTKPDQPPVEVVVDGEIVSPTGAKP